MYTLHTLIPLSLAPSPAYTRGGRIHVRERDTLRRSEYFQSARARRIANEERSMPSEEHNASRRDQTKESRGNFQRNRPGFLPHETDPLLPLALWSKKASAERISRERPRIFRRWHLHERIALRVRVSHVRQSVFDYSERRDAQKFYFRSVDSSVNSLARNRTERVRFLSRSSSSLPLPSVCISNTRRK